MRYRLFNLIIILALITLGISGCGGEGTSADPLGTDTITLTSSATQVDPNGIVVLTATVKTASGEPVSGREVYFAFVASPSGATLSPPITKTNAAGEVNVLYTAGTTPGLDVVRASLSYTKDVSMDIGITVGTGGGGGGGGGGGTIGTYTVSISPSTASVTAGQVSIITATVTSESTSVSGVTVTFTLPVNSSAATLNSLLSVTATTDGSGKAVVIYQPGNSSPTLTVQDTVRAAVGTATSAVVITRVGSAVSAYGITATTAPPTLATNGSNSVITATVKNSAGTAISGVTVNFAVTGVLPVGTLSVASATTDGSGNAVTTFTGNGAAATGDTSVVTASITISGNTYTNAVIITYP